MLIILIAVIILLILFCFWQNNSIVISNTKYRNEKIPKKYHNFKIVQISDLHGHTFGKNQSRLLKKIKDLNPDIILVTGDIIDSRRYKLAPAMMFMRGAVKIAPVYYVSGNHELRDNRYDIIAKSFVDVGVNVLENEFLDLGDITIIGLMSPYYNYTDGSEIKCGTKSNPVDVVLSEMYQSGEECLSLDCFKIVLCHHPELIQTYKKYDLDLVFTGHAHGGQIRLPILGGLFAPEQGYFPKYTSGFFVENNTTMYVNRGLGNSSFPIRVFNRPEIVCVELEAQ